MSRTAAVPRTPRSLWERGGGASGILGAAARTVAIVRASTAPALVVPVT